MDRINKFLSKKCNKNQRTVIHKEKEVTITKSDVQKIKRYKQNRCLDPDLVLYQPFSTKYSKDTLKNPLIYKKRKDLLKHRYNLFIERVRKYKKYVPKDINLIYDIWKDDNKLEGEYKIESFVSESNKINGFMDDKEFTKKDFEDYISELKKYWYTEIPRKKYKIEDLLPKIIDKSEFDIHAKEVSKKYNYNEFINTFYIDEYFHCIALNFSTFVTINDLKNNREYFRFNYEETVNNVILTLERLFVIFSKRIEIIDLSNKKLIIEATKKEEESLFWNEQKNEKIQNFFTFENNKIIINHKNRIKNYSYNVKENFLAIITGKVIILHDIINHKSYQPVKLKTELPLKIELNKKCTFILIATTNNFYIYDFKVKKIMCKIESVVNCAHTFSHKEEYVIIGDKENRLVVVNNNKIVRVMEQDRRIMEIVCHKRYNYFCVVFKDEIILFLGKMLTDFECSIMARYKGVYKNVRFHDTLHWIYAIQNESLVIFT